MATDGLTVITKIMANTSVQLVTLALHAIGSRSNRRARSDRPAARSSALAARARARRLFVTHGYGATTIQAIAQAAKVAPQTVYATFGSKRRMLIALLDRIAADADLPQLERDLASAGGDTSSHLRQLLAFTGRFYASGADLIDLARTVSGVEPDLAVMWQTGEDRRYRAHSKLIDQWVAAGRLAAGVPARDAHALLWALSGPDVYRLLVVERRWSQQRRIEILGRLLESALFSEAPAAQAHDSRIST